MTRGRMGPEAPDPQSQAFVTLDRVSLVYGGTPALEGVELSVPRGAFAAVVGPSGCGKSSLLRLVAGLARPTEGRVRVDGAAVDAPLKCVGMAFQNPTLLPWRSTLGNVLLPLEVAEATRRRFRREKARHVERARALLATVGLAGFEEHPPYALSGGMQQRASLCRALAHEPALLLLDEPFGALDPFTREDLWSVLQDLWMRRGFTVILVTHDLREAVFLADTVHVVSERPGRIVESRPIDLPRPRTLAASFEDPFVAHVHALRDRIAAVRGAPPVEGQAA